MLARADSAGATHGFLDALRARGILFSVGFDLTEPVREALTMSELRKGSDACTITIRAWCRRRRCLVMERRRSVNMVRRGCMVLASGGGCRW
jgi:hypothetical protein